MSALIVAALCAALAFSFALADSAMLGASLAGDPAPPLPARERQHRALAFARLLAQLGAGVALARALRLHERPAASAALLALGVGMLVVALTEVAAREVGDALAGRRGERAVAPLRPVVALAETLLAPAVTLAVRLDEALLRALPPQAPTELSREEVQEQFREVVAAEAEVSGEERALLASVFEFGETPVSEIMVPRVDVIGVERTVPWSEAVDRVRSSEHSRLPVYEDTIDDIVGVLYAKDLLPSVIADEEPEAGWASLVRTATFIPGTKRLDALLREFRQSGTHMAVVVDEYGGTAGIVTIEDVLEEIVGEIRDERDEDDDAPIESQDDRRFWVSARVTLDELSEALGVEVAHDEVTTVGGLVYELLGRVPRAGERLEVAGFRVVVERVIRRKIQRVYFERLAAPDAPEAEGTAEEPAATRAPSPDRLPGRPTARRTAEATDAPQERAP